MKRQCQAWALILGIFFLGTLQAPEPSQSYQRSSNNFITALIDGTITSPKEFSSYVKLQRGILNKPDDYGQLISIATILFYPTGFNQLVNAKIDLRQADKEGTTPLLAAAETGVAGIINMLIKNGIRVDETTPERVYNTALMIASSEGRANVIPLLLANGANPNRQNLAGGNALAFAAFKQNPTIVTDLLNAGAQIDLPDQDGRTALMFAAASDSPVTFQRLLDAGANVNATTVDEMTPLLGAATALEARFKDKKKPLTKVERDRRSKIILTLLLHGADPKKANKRGSTFMKYVQQYPTFARIWDQYERAMNPTIGLLEDLGKLNANLQALKLT